MDVLRVALALTGFVSLLLPLPVSAQESPRPWSPALPAFLLWTDASGDLRDPTSGEPEDGPGYADIIGLDVSLQGDELTVRFDVAEPLPEVTDPMPTAAYRLDIDTDGDGSADWSIQMVSGPQGWREAVEAHDAHLATPGEGYRETAGVADGDVTTTVQIPGLTGAAEPRFQGLAFASATPPGQEAPLDTWAWFDRVPDAEDEWRSLGDSQCICDG